MERNVSDMFKSKYLKHGDFPDPRVCTMLRVDDEEMTGQKGPEVNPVLYFKEVDKGCVLNRTNAAAIAEVYGDMLSGWWGKQMEVYADLNVTNPNGQRVGGIRMRKPSRQQFAAPAGLSWPDAQARAAAAGISKDALVAGLKAAGETGWNAVNGPVVLDRLLAAATASQGSSDFGTPPDDSIPF